MIDPAFSSKDWKPIHHRVEPITSSNLLLRLLVVRHRREPDRSALLTEILVRDGPGELRSEGGTTMELHGASDARCRQLFDECLERVLPWREAIDE